MQDYIQQHHILLSASDDIKDIDLAYLDLNVRLGNIFTANNIKTIRDLIEYDYISLILLPNMGQTSMRLLESILQDIVNRAISEIQQQPISLTTWNFKSYIENEGHITGK